MNYINKFQIIPVVFLSILLDVRFLSAQHNPGNNSQSLSRNTFPDSVKYIVQPFYRHRPDGRPGREIVLNFKGRNSLEKGQLILNVRGVTETTAIRCK